MKKTTLISLLFTLVLTACANNAETESTPTVAAVILPTNTVVKNTPTPPAYLPLPSDHKLTRANAFPKSINLIAVERDPLRLELAMSGYVPTPCHELRVFVPPPDEENNIYIEVYSVTAPEMLCEQVLRAFDTTVDLGSYPSGSYWVWVNGERVGNFDS